MKKDKNGDSETNLHEIGHILGIPRINSTKIVFTLLFIYKTNIFSIFAIFFTKSFQVLDRKKGADTNFLNILGKQPKPSIQ